MNAAQPVDSENASRPIPRRLDFLPCDFEGVDLYEARCTRCTPACNIFRIVSVDGEKLVLCGKKAETQTLLNNQRRRLGIPDPGQAP